MKQLLTIIMGLFLFPGSFTTALGQSTSLLFNANYETGTMDSGIPGVIGTNTTTAPDAAYMISPGFVSNYGIAHKIVVGDSAYFHGNNFRSESEADIPAASFVAGDERRYEFSFLLKDWEPWIEGQEVHESNIFQTKITGPSLVPLMVRVLRNQIVVRLANSETTSTLRVLVDDYRSYINQWIHIRIDAKWSAQTDGYFKAYAKLPGEADYVQKVDIPNIRNYTGDGASGQHGRPSWGVYAGTNGFTRIIYHDDVKVYGLNMVTTPVTLWDNPINDANPATQPGPYAPATDVVAANVVNNSTSPSSDFSRTTLTPGSAVSGRYLLSGWVSGAAGAPSPFDATEYYEFKVAPEAGYKLDFSNMTFYWRTGNATHPNTYVLRSSLDGFASNISAPVTVSDDAANTGNFGNTSTYDLSGISATGEITFRMYWYGATGTGGLVGIDNFAFNGNVSPVSLPVTFSTVSAKSVNGVLQVNWSTDSETNNDRFEVETSRDGVSFSKIGTVVSKISHGKSSLLQHYQFSVNSIALLGMPAILLLLFAGFTNRSSKKAMALVLAAVLLIIGCAKRDISINPGDETLFVRVKKIDKNNQFEYSKIVRVVNE